MLKSRPYQTSKSTFPTQAGLKFQHNSIAMSVLFFALSI